jgi:hypothetical protein
MPHFDPATIPKVGVHAASDTVEALSVCRWIIIDEAATSVVVATTGALLIEDPA